MKRFVHYHARSIGQAISLLNKYNGKARVNAGGTDLINAMKEKCLPAYPEVIVNIKTIPGLDYIREDESGIRIGALTKLSRIADAPEVNGSYRMLTDAARSVATPQVRNMCTVGGNLAQETRCWYYRYPAELGGPITCLRKGGKVCNALTGDNRYHSIFGAAALEERPCSAGCPARTDIPSYLGRFRDGDLLEAARDILNFNPIPAITGRVCPTFCEPECNRSAFDEAVSIRCVERSLGDYMLDNASEIYAPPEAESGVTIAIVGSGPAGLAAAYYLRRTGHRVTVFEKMEEPGGMLLYSIPSYRLPKDVVRKQVRALERMGVAFECGVQIGQRANTALTDLMERFNTVLIAGGAWKEKSARIKGEDLFLSGLQFLREVNSGEATLPGRKVAVIGGGNVAIDVARTLRRLGAEPTILYRRSLKEMPAFEDEVAKAGEEGIKMQFLTLPTKAVGTNGRITLTCVRMKLGSPDASGRRQPVPRPGSEFTTVFDAIIKAIGEEADGALVSEEFRQQMRKPGPSARLLGKNLFAAGDFLSGPSTVIEAVAAGRQAATLIERTLGKGQPSSVKEASATPLSRPSFNRTPRLTAPFVPAGERVKALGIEDLPEVSLDAARKEAGRCVDCGCLAVGPSDVGLALVALDANIVTTKRTIGAADFFAAHARASHVLESDELITEIRIPKPPAGVRQHFAKFTLRKPVDFAIVSVAALITEEDGICADARIALGAVAPAPIRMPAAEQALIGKPVSEATAAQAAEAALAGAWPLAMNEYKIEITKTLVRRAILGEVS